VNKKTEEKKMAMKDDVYKSFNSKTTKELQKIWDENDRNEYSTVAFEVIEEILKKRNDAYKNFNSKTIEELQKIWNQNDRNEYSTVAFEVIEEILKKKKNEVYKSFNSKTIEELQKILDEKDRNEYSTVTFEVIKKIIKKRNESIKLPENKDRLKSTDSNANKVKNKGGFWSFDKMISGILIKILYVLGVLGLIVTGAVMFADDDTILIGIGIIIFGNILWRIICEGIIIAFKMFEKLNQIEQKI